MFFYEYRDFLCERREILYECREWQVFWFYGFVVFWFYGIEVLWFFGFLVFWNFKVLQIYLQQSIRE
jgi:hypothetical protein